MFWWCKITAVGKISCCSISHNTVEKVICHIKLGRVVKFSVINVVIPITTILAAIYWQNISLFLFIVI